MGAQPIWSRRACVPRSARNRAVLRVVLAVATTALFTLTPNFWLLLSVHLAVETVIAGWLPLPK